MWNQVRHIGSREYICYFCNKTVASSVGYDGSVGYIHICPHCNRPTYFYGGRIQVPKPLPLSPVTGVEDNVRDLFEEARKCISTESYTAVAMLCRKLLMNIAVDQGAKKNKKFQEYVEYIQEENLVSKNAKELLTEIKDIGNDANHEISQVSEEQANQIIKFINEVIRQIYRVKSLSLRRMGFENE